MKLKKYESVLQENIIKDALDFYGERGTTSLSFNSDFNRFLNLTSKHNGSKLVGFSFSRGELFVILEGALLRFSYKGTRFPDKESPFKLETASLIQ